MAERPGFPGGHLRTAEHAEKTQQGKQQLVNHLNDQVNSFRQRLVIS